MKKNLLTLFVIPAMLCIFIGIATTTDASAEKKSPGKPVYVIGPEDVLEVSVWKNTDLSRSVIVRPDGKISLPLLGEIKAAGLTPEQLHLIITKKLGQYQQAVEASVIVKEINSYKVFLFGDVIKPGVYSMKRRTSLVQAIAMAGGFNQFASRNSIVVIRESTDGLSERLNVRFDDIIHKKNFAGKNMILKPGDTIFVP